jgi:hypothetical protein
MTVPSMFQSDLVLRNPTRVIDGLIQVDGIGDGSPRPLRHLGGHTVGELLPRWRAELLFSGFAPIYLLELVHENGERATWYLDSQAHRLGGTLAELQPVVQGLLVGLASPAVGLLWRNLTQEGQPTLIDPAAAALLELNAETRLGLALLCQARVGPKMNQLALEQMRSPLHFQHRGHLLALQRETLTKLLAANYQDLLLNGFHDGVVRVPNPLGGDDLSFSGAIVFDDFHFAYRLIDPQTGLVTFLFVMGHNSRPAFLYVPILDLVLGFANNIALAGRFLKELPSLVFSHVMRHAQSLEPYLCRNWFELVAITRGLPGAHLGHQLWNELTGLEALAINLSPERLPRCMIVSGQEEIEHFGKIDRIFPSFFGKVDRTIVNSVHLTSVCYEQGLCPARVTREYISENLRQTLLSQLRQTDEFKIIQHILAMADAPLPLVIVIGIRVENRTAADLADFLTRVLTHLARFAPGVVVVIDGHNSRTGQAGKTIESHMEALANRRPVDVERELAATLISRLAGLPIRLVDNVGASVAASLAWSDLSDGFIAFWGAGLAKYRWVTNKPGFVISSHINLTTRQDLYIYDHPDYMENPTTVVFADPSCVVDDPSNELLVPVDAGPYYANFRVNDAILFEQLDGYLRSLRSGPETAA